MRALTICQPYAHLIVTQQAELPIGAVPKRVENRTWETRYRGLLLIHAGKSMKFLHGDDRTKYPEMKFGAIIGIAHLIDCVRAINLCYLRLTKDGHPQHPLYLPRDLTPTPWNLT